MVLICRSWLAKDMNLRERELTLLEKEKQLRDEELAVVVEKYATYKHRQQLAMDLAKDKRKKCISIDDSDALKSLLYQEFCDGDLVKMDPRGPPKSRSNSVSSHVSSGSMFYGSFLKRAVSELQSKAIAQPTVQPTRTLVHCAPID